MYVAEVDKIFKVDGKDILYDYYTPEEFRRAGKFHQLIESTLIHLNADTFVFALDNNIASNKGLQNVGFRKSKEYKLR